MADGDELFVGFDLAAEGGRVEKSGEIGGRETERVGERGEGEFVREDGADQGVGLGGCRREVGRERGHGGSVRVRCPDASAFGGVGSFGRANRPDARGFTDNSLSVGSSQGAASGQV